MKSVWIVVSLMITSAAWASTPKGGGKFTGQVFKGRGRVVTTVDGGRKTVETVERRFVLHEQDGRLKLTVAGDAKTPKGRPFTFTNTTTGKTVRDKKRGTTRRLKLRFEGPDNLREDQKLLDLLTEGMNHPPTLKKSEQDVTVFQDLRTGRLKLRASSLWETIYTNIQSESVFVLDEVSE